MAAQNSSATTRCLLLEPLENEESNYSLGARGGRPAFFLSSASTSEKAFRSFLSARIMDRITNQKMRPTSTVGVREKIAFPQKSCGTHEGYGLLLCDYGESDEVTRFVN